MDVQIDGQHTAVEPAVQAWIRQRLDALNTPHGDMLHARVTLVKHERHQQGADEARVLVTLPGTTLRVTRCGQHLLMPCTQRST